MGVSRANLCMFAEPTGEWIGGFATPGFTHYGSVNNLRARGIAWSPESQARRLSASGGPCSLRQTGGHRKAFPILDGEILGPTGLAQ
jgi:hypothetical protein